MIIPLTLIPASFPPFQESGEGGDDMFEYAVCAMQGWRTDMEDAHMVVLNMANYDDDHKSRPHTALFGVFDGHGGKEVARFAAAHLPTALKNTPAYSSGDMHSALSQAFLGIDELLVMEEHREELNALKGGDEEAEAAGGEGAMTINSSQLPDGLLEALGMSGESGYVFRIVKTPSGQMRITGDGDEEEEGEEEEEGAEGAEGLARDPNGDVLSPFASASAGSNGKRKRSGDMDVDEEEGKEMTAGEGEPSPAAQEVVIEDVGHTHEEEEPWAGPSAGCTAVCALVRDGELHVANAGDSRCVLSRGGTAVALTTDHKPMDAGEYDRIIKAGGFVADGRVNGSLNLSRALGDLEYKQTKELPPEAQMVTASPEVRSIPLAPEDEFLVLACDGIWDVLTNQEAVDFVRERLLAGKAPKAICEEMCDHCLAPDTNGCGKGCDNMSVVVAVFKGSALAKEAAAAREKAAAEGSKGKDK